jgi:LuxR family glucitol operon transcriptional activator
MARITETRITLAAFIYGIETDLKNLIKKYITPFQEDISFFQDSELVAKVIDRFNKENPGINYKNNLDDIIDYVDFHDSFVILRRNNIFLPKFASEYLNDIYKELSDLTPIRNRVMHTRPLLGGDF